jgi:hypothetical protein
VSVGNVARYGSPVERRRSQARGTTKDGALVSAEAASSLEFERMLKVLERAGDRVNDLLARSPRTKRP